ncbi:EAL domain-containing response regulator [Ramlibacter sp. 2FC]|uniref:EAL domain-containing response regulator n=1 Tax=Ramlibacter sp. 2FC TaxID=2502188 RepID=UPI0010F76E56|nr:EAL domain-containing response regulator [Ramlibacter sp. 2FC]
MSKRLLILDDESAVAQTMEVVARRSGFDVRCCVDPAVFFVELERWQPSHVVVDLVMPKMDGIEVIRLLASRGCAAWLIVTSGMGAKILESARRVATQRGLNFLGLLPKPFTPKALRELLDCPPPQDSLHSQQSMWAAYTEDDITPEVLEQAIACEQFELHYQPRLQLSSGRLAGFEALVRWEHPDLGTIRPSRFIPMAEACGLIGALSDWVFRTGLRWLAGQPASREVSLSLNLSPSALQDLALADALSAQCAQLGLATQRVTLELTESSAVRNFGDALDILTRLRIKGFHLSIDDFGTGYASMTQLSRLPFTELKVDKSFVMSMVGSSESRDIVAASLDLGQKLGLTTVAEGVENTGTLQLLKALGCDQVQGYLLARPMPADAARDWTPSL